MVQNGALSVDASGVARRRTLLSVPGSRWITPAVMQIFFRSAGLASLALGMIGLVLPLLPTTPFLILATFCFARSSPALEHRLLHHPTFGPHIIAWRQNRAISRKGKLAAVIALAVSAVTGFLTISPPWSFVSTSMCIILGAWLLMRPTVDVHHQVEEGGR